MLHKADLKAGNDLIILTTDGKLFQLSIGHASEFYSRLIL